MTVTSGQSVKVWSGAFMPLAAMNLSASLVSVCPHVYIMVSFFCIVVSCSGGVQVMSLGIPAYCLRRVGAVSLAGVSTLYILYR